MSDREFIAWALVTMLSVYPIPYLLWRARALRFQKALTLADIQLGYELPMDARRSIRNALARQ